MQKSITDLAASNSMLALFSGQVSNSSSLSESSALCRFAKISRYLRIYKYNETLLKIAYILKKLLKMLHIRDK